MKMKIGLLFGLLLYGHLTTCGQDRAELESPAELSHYFVDHSETDQRLVVTSNAGVTWKLEMAVGEGKPGGGCITALYVPSKSTKNLVETNLIQRHGGHLYGVLGLDNLEWRTTSSSGTQRKDLGRTNSDIVVDIIEASALRIRLDISGKWSGVSGFTAEITIEPTKIHKKIEIDFTASRNAYGMLWSVAGFAPGTIDRNGVRMFNPSGSSSGISLPVLENTQFSSQFTNFEYPYEVEFPLVENEGFGLLMEVATMGVQDMTNKGLHALVLADEGPEDRHLVFYPRYHSNPFTNDKYYVEYIWTLAHELRK